LSLKTRHVNACEQKERRINFEAFFLTQKRERRLSSITHTDTAKTIYTQPEEKLILHLF